MIKRASNKYLYLLALVPFLVVALLYEILPLATVVYKSFLPDAGGAFTLENYQTIASKLLYRKAITNSLKISITSALVGIVIAFLGARAAHERPGKMNRAFTAVLNMVSNFAGIPLAFAYMILLGNTGLVVNIGKELGISALANYELYTMNGMSLIYIYFQIPLSSSCPRSSSPPLTGSTSSGRKPAPSWGAPPGSFGGRSPSRS